MPSRVSAVTRQGTEVSVEPPEWTWEDLPEMEMEEEEEEDLTDGPVAGAGGSVLRYPTTFIPPPRPHSWIQPDPAVQDLNPTPRIYRFVDDHEEVEMGESLRAWQEEVGATTHICYITQGEAQRYYENRHPLVPWIPRGPRADAFRPHTSGDFVVKYTWMRDWTPQAQARFSPDYFGEGTTQIILPARGVWRVMTSDQDTSPDRILRAHQKVPLNLDWDDQAWLPLSLTRDGENLLGPDPVEIDVPWRYQRSVTELVDYDATTQGMTPEFWEEKTLKEGPPLWTACMDETALPHAFAWPWEWYWWTQGVYWRVRQLHYPEFIKLGEDQGVAVNRWLYHQLAAVDKEIWECMRGNVYVGGYIDPQGMGTPRWQFPGIEPPPAPTPMAAFCDLDRW